MKQTGGGGADDALRFQEDMARGVREAVRDVEEHAFHMTHAIDQSQPLDEVVKHAQDMVRPLRTGTLSPKSYYEVWMKVFDHLRSLYTHFLGLNKRGKPMAELYQAVQSCGHIIPRLYLMITVGSAFLISREASSEEILTDLIEMSKGVQHPMRGLFLRNYLLKMTQDKLSSGFQVSKEFTISFLLQNFGEMNRLWVRMQHQGTARNRQRREKERRDLKILISFNLVHLSQFEGLSLEKYQTYVLNQILDVVTNCKDTIAQQYLLDVLVQVFPAEYHLETMDKLFESFEHLETDVDLKSVLVSLMDRIIYYKEEEEEEEEEGEGEGDQDDSMGLKEEEEDNDENHAKVEMKEEEEGGGEGDQDVSTGPKEEEEDNDGNNVKVEVKEKEQENGKVSSIHLRTPKKISPDVFRQLSLVISEVITERKTVSLEGILDLQVSLLGFAVACYPGELSYIDEILGFCSDYVSKHPISSEERANVDPLIVSLLKVPLRQQELGSIDLLGLVHYPKLVGGLLSENKLKVAHSFLLHVLADKDLVFDAIGDVSSLLSFIAPLLHDDEGVTGVIESSESKSAFQNQQFAVAKFVHRLESKDLNNLFEILELARKKFLKGGAKRQRYTLMPLASRYIILIDRMREEEGTPVSGDIPPKMRKSFQHLHELGHTLGEIMELQDFALRVFIRAGLCADRAKEQEVAYDFMVEVFTIYEDIADSKDQLRTLPLLIGAMQMTTGFTKESYETLCIKTMQYGVRMLKKPDQCKMVLASSHLFWHLDPERSLQEDEKPPPPGRDEKRADDCLKRAHKIAKTCMDASVHVSLLLQILDKLIFFYDAGMSTVTAESVSDLMGMVKQSLTEMEDETTNKRTLIYVFDKTMQHLKLKKQANPGKYEFV